MRRIQLGLTFTLLIVLAAASLGAAPVPTLRPPVTVPVVLESVRYEPAEFNALRRSALRDVTLGFVVVRNDPQILYAFYSVDEARAFIGARAARSSSSLGGKLARPLNRPATSHLGSCQGHADPVYSKFYESANCAGAFLQVFPGGSMPDLRNPCSGCGDWNDRLSSVACSPGPDTYICALWEHINWTGNWIFIQHGTGVNLSAFGFDNIASSLIVYLWPS